MASEYDEKPVTIWLLRRLPLGASREDNLTERVWIFNHIEDGHVSHDAPIPKSDEQQKWRNGTWRKLYGCLRGTELFSPEPLTVSEA